MPAYPVKAKMLSRLLAVTMAGVGVAQAGPVTIRPPDHGNVAVTVKYDNGSTRAFAGMQDNGPGDEDHRLGYFTFTAPDEAHARSIEVRSIGVNGNFAALTDFDFGPANMLAYEPIDSVQFSANDINVVVLATIDVGAFSAQALAFTAGEILSVSDGAAAGVAGVEFRDASSRFTPGGFGSFFDIFVELDPVTLPLFTGQVRVQPAVEFRPLGEPTTLLLAGLGLGAAARGKKTARRPARGLSARGRCAGT